MGATRKNLDTRYSVRLSRTTYRKLHKLPFLERRSIASYVRKLVDQALADNGKKGGQ